MTDAPASRVRARSPVSTDLTFEFDARPPSSELTAGEPAWLRADRRAAFDAFEALPAETNQLYTTYIDLRTRGPR